MDTWIGYANGNLGMIPGTQQTSLGKAEHQLKEDGNIRPWAE